MYRRPICLIRTSIGPLLALVFAFQTNAANNIEVVDDGGGIPSLALDTNGYPVVSHYSIYGRDLIIVHCNDVNCTGADETIEIADASGDVGAFSSLKLDSNGYPVVSYYAWDSGDLKILHCNDVNCSGGDDSIQTVDSAGDVGRFTSLALDSNGYPVVSYWDVTNRDLKILHCNDPNCSGGDESIQTIRRVPVPGVFGNIGFGFYNSLVLDDNGYPVVSYGDDAYLYAWVLHCNDPNCSGDDDSIQFADNGTDGRYCGIYTSLVLDGNGYPVVSCHDLQDMDLKVIHCNDANCSGGDESIERVDTAGDVGGYTSLALDLSGFPVVSYYDGDNADLKVLHCNDVNCSGGDDSIERVDSILRVGTDSTLVLDTSGYPVIAYQDLPNGDLKLVHCGDGNCTNTAPVADAGGPYTGLQGVGIDLSGLGSTDPDKNRVSYLWTINPSSDCGFRFNNPTRPETVLTCAASGNYSLTLTVDDGDLNDSDTVNVRVLTPEQGITALQDELVGLVGDGILTEGQARGLTRPLDNALRSLDKGQTAAACSQLQDFIDEVYAKTPTPLDAATAVELIFEAEALRSSIGC